MSEAAADLIDRLLSDEAPDPILDLDVDALLFPGDPPAPVQATGFPTSPIAQSGRIINAVTNGPTEASAAITAAGGDAASVHTVACRALQIGGHDWTDAILGRHMLAWYLRSLDALEPLDEA